MFYIAIAIATILVVVYECRHPKGTVNLLKGKK